MNTKTPAERKEHKRTLVTNILAIEQQILANANDPKLLTELRADYRRACDELALYYDDDPAERAVKP